jgi:hypothetical protein
VSASETPLTPLTPLIPLPRSANHHSSCLGGVSSLWSLGAHLDLADAGLHLFDAIVIVGTIIVETSLRGTERELAGLLVLLRLWRLIKLVRLGRSLLPELHLQTSPTRGVVPRTSRLRAGSMMSMGTPGFSPDLRALTPVPGRRRSSGCGRLGRRSHESTRAKRRADQSA